MQPELGCRDFEFGVENSVVGATTAEFTPLLTILNVVGGVAELALFTSKKQQNKNTHIYNRMLPAACCGHGQQS
jgi:hypothetical protein